MDTWLSGLLSRKIKFPLHRIYFYWTRSCLKVFFALFCRKFCNVAITLLFVVVANVAITRFFVANAMITRFWGITLLRILAEILGKNLAGGASV